MPRPDGEGIHPAGSADDQGRSVVRGGLPAGVLHRRISGGRATPVMVMWNGLDSTKEHMYTSGFPGELAARGISTLMVDCPGSGEALRLRGLTTRVTTEDWAAACVDYLEARPMSARTGSGWSAGPSVATTPPGQPRSRSDLPYASRGGPTTTGAPFSGGVWSGKARTRYRTTGTMSCGSGARPTWTRSSGWPRPSTSTASSSTSVSIPHRARTERPTDPTRVRPPLL